MSERLKIDTKTTLFEPVEVEIDGVVLRVKRQTLKTLKSIQKLWEDMRAGSAEAVSTALGTLFEGETAILDDLPLDKLSEVIEFAIRESSNAGRSGKNPSGPGDKSLPS